MLPNHLKCMLVSDSSAQSASASLSVSVGSLDDPPEVEGLAHLVEHMLTKGSDDFPAESHYSWFIKTHGGVENAETCEDFTRYYF